MKTAVVFTTAEDTDFPANTLNNFVLGGLIIRVLGISLALPLIPIGLEDLWIDKSCIIVDLPQFFTEEFGRYERCLALMLHYLRASAYLDETSQLEEKVNDGIAVNSDSEEKDWREMSSRSNDV